MKQDRSRGSCEKVSADLLVTGWHLSCSAFRRFDQDIRNKKKSHKKRWNFSAWYISHTPPTHRGRFLPPEPWICKHFCVCACLFIDKAVAGEQCRWLRLKSGAINAGFHITLGAITRTSAKNSRARTAARQKRTDGGWENTERGKSPSVCRRQTLLTMAVRLWSLERKKKKGAQMRWECSDERETGRGRRGGRESK